MKILMLLFNRPYPPDERVSQEIKSLQAAGHQVKLLGPRGKGQKARERVEGVEVIRLKRYPFVAFELLVVHKACQMNKEWDFDVVHKHDIPMGLGTAVMIKKMLGKKLVIDLHENWTGLMRAASGRKPDMRTKILIKFMERTEKRLLEEADGVISLCPEEIERLEAMVPGTREKTWPVGNFAHVENIKGALRSALEGERAVELPQVIGEALKFINKRESTVIYYGALGAHRGVDTLIRGFARAARDRPGAGLVITGDNPGKSYLRELRALVKDLGIESSVFFTGWVDYPHGMLLIHRSDLGTVPYARTPQTENAVPHKLFQYMYLGKPLLVSDVSSLKRVVKEAGCGMVARAGDPKDFHKVISEALGMGRERLAEMGASGKGAVTERYNWDKAAENLLDLYNTI